MIDPIADNLTRALCKACVIGMLTVATSAAAQPTAPPAPTAPTTAPPPAPTTTAPAPPAPSQPPAPHGWGRPPQQAPADNNGWSKQSPNGQSSYDYQQPYNGWPADISFHNPNGAAPETLPYEEGDAIPAGYHIKTENYRWVVGVGGLIAGSAYQLSFSAAAIGTLVGETDFAFLFIPVAGPWILMPQVDGDSHSFALLLADGALQVAGVAAMIGGLVAKDEYLVRSHNIALTVAPLASRDIQGLQLLGEF